MVEIVLLLILIWGSGFLLGASALLYYILWRMMRSDGWDDSNLTNALRLLSHVTIHPEDFGEMWYIDSVGTPIKRPFWYVSEDEFEGVVRSRPVKR